MENHDTLLFFGGEVKALGGGRVGGYLARFTTPKDPDLARDFFTKETDFFLEDGEGKAVVLYDHGLDPKIKARKLGKGSVKVDDVGAWIESQLNMADEYEKAIYAMAKAGKLGWSSGSAPHLVEREAVGKAFFIKSWPIVEASLTPRPCEPRNRAMPLKSYAEDPEHKDFDEFFEGEESTPQLKFQEHSETVATAVEEHATKTGELAEEVKSFLSRVRNRLEFRELKDGRTISKPNRERLTATRGRLSELRESLSSIEAELDELLSLAEPKPKAQSAFEMSPEGGKSLTGDELAQAALDAVTRFETLRFELTAAPSRE